MFARLRMTWADIRDSLWFIPATFTIAAAALALVLVQLEQAYQWELGKSGYWLLAGGVEGSRQVLSTIAGSLITVTGVVFSVTIVALQLASSQFTPRILRSFMADRTNQVVLGVFISTFTYTLLVLRVIRSKAEEEQEFIPHAAIAVSILLAIISIACLIYFVHHVARSIQASVILSRVTDQALKHVERLFPDDLGAPDKESNEQQDTRTDPSSNITAGKAGYVQAVDGRGLFDLGAKHELVLRMAIPVGQFVQKGQVIAEVWSKAPLEQAIIDRVRTALILGEERTPEQDFEFCVGEIAEVAVKALSPGINDPTTALHCIDRLIQILLALGSRRSPFAMRTESGQVHFIAQHSTFEGVLELALSQIYQFGRDNPLIVQSLRDSIELLHQLLPAERHEALQPWRKKLEEAT